MKKLIAIVKPSRKDDFVALMESCSVYGIMQTDIKGYGNQGGYDLFYRGVECGNNLITKVKLETIGDDDTIALLEKMIVKKMSTGKIGDGKIFIENVDDVIRIRTGERGEAAL